MDDIEWDEESAPLGKGTPGDPVYQPIGNSFGVMVSGQPLRMATEVAEQPGVITLDMRDENGELVMLDVPNAVALGRRLLMAAMYWIDMHGICDRGPVVEARDCLNSALEFEWHSTDEKEGDGDEG